MKRTTVKIFLTLFALAFSLQGVKGEEPVVSSSAPQTAILRQRLSKERIYPQQPFEIHVELYLAEVPGNRLRLDPFTRSRAYQDGKPPVLLMPWIDENTLAQEIRPLARADYWLNTIPRGEFGFSINGLFQNGYNNKRIIFRPEGKKTELKDKDAHEHSYWKYELSRAYVADAEGDFEFAASEFYGVFLGMKNESELLGERVQVKSEPISYRVLAVPRGENRPENDLGLFGVFRWNVELHPKTAKVGEPLTLTITFQGVGSIKKIKAPNLAADARITEAFRVYPPTEELLADSCSYTYTIRPKQSGSVVFPDLDFSYFNVETENFEPLKSSPITTTIQPAEFLEERDITTHEDASIRPRQGELQKITGGIFANMSERSGAVNRRVNARTYFVCFAALGGVFFLVVFQRNARGWFRGASAVPSRHWTVSQAKSRLIRLRSLLNEGKQYECCAQTLTILVEFVANIEGIASHDLTPHNVLEILRRWSYDTKSISRVGRYFDALEAVRYGTLSSRDANETAIKGLQILDVIIQLLPSGKAASDTALETAATSPTQRPISSAGTGVLDPDLSQVESTIHELASRRHSVQKSKAERREP